MMTLRVRFYIGFMLSASLTIFLGFFALQSYSQVARQYDALQDQGIPGALFMLETKTRLLDLSAAVERVVSTGDLAYWERASAAVPLLRQDLATYTDRELNRSPDRIREIRVLEERIGRTILLFDSMAAQVEQGGSTEQISRLRRSIDSDLNSLLPVLDTYATRHRRELDSAIVTVDQTISGGTRAVWVAIVLAVLASGGVSYALIRMVLDPLRMIQSGSERIASGDFAHRIPLNRADEIGTLARAFNTMTESLQKRDGELLHLNRVLADQVQELSRAKAVAQESARLKSEFLANMSHELRTPLNAIMGFVGLMLDGMGGEFDDDTRRMLDRVHANSHRLLGLINDVLNIAKIEAGRMEIVSRLFNLRELVERWQKETSVLAQQRGLAFTIDVDPDLPAVLQGDPERLTQIALNLLSNAFKFTEQGHVHLTVRRQPENWQIIVKDSGIGIPPHALDFIFEEFRQVDGSSTRVYGGSGLGLAIVRNLCQLMGGSVKVASELGSGSTFTVTLPLVTEAEALPTA